MLQATGLGRRFGDLWAVRGMDLSVARGEVLGLLGPNGAGKTTTVRMLTALIAPSEGTATVEGFDVHEQPDEVRTRIGILTETPGLYDKLSARDNLEFFARLYDLDAATRAERIERYLRLFSLWDRRDDIAGAFSKGMKQKLAIARALLHDPAVVFLDEPTAALDPEAAFVVREAIEDLRRAGRTIVLATHNLDEADRLCDRVAFVRGGLLRVDSPAGLRAATGVRGVDVTLASPADEALAAVARSVPGVSGATAAGLHVAVAAEDPATVTPELVRALVAGRGRDHRGPRARVDPRGRLLRDHGCPAGRRRRGRVMRARIVTTVLRREWLETSRNRLLMGTILFPPIMLTIAPIVLAGVIGERSLPDELAAVVLTQRPEWSSFTPSELAGAFAVQQFLVFFLLMPAYIPLAIATFSIIGEKQARSLEPVLAAPIRTVELLAGKVIAALVPGVLAGWLTYLVFVALASFVYGTALLRRRHRPVVAHGRLRAGTGRRVVVGRGRRHRQLPGHGPAGRPADRRHHHRADHRGDPAPGHGDRPRRRDRVLHPRGHRHDRQPDRAADRCRALRPGSDPDPLALNRPRAAAMQRNRPGCGFWMTCTTPLGISR